MKIGRLATQFQYSIMTIVLMSVCPGGALAQNGHPHATTTQPQQLTSAQGALLKIVRDNTERFKDVSVAEAEGYSLLFGCVSGPDAGAMGLHYVNLSLVAAGVVDATRPQIVIYEPMPDGHLQLIGADFLVLASDWDKAHPGQGRLSSWDSSFIISRAPIASASQLSTRFMCGHGREILTGPS
jgi:hypothetical protein